MGIKNQFLNKSVIRHILYAGMLEKIDLFLANVDLSEKKEKEFVTLLENIIFEVTDILNEDEKKSKDIDQEMSVDNAG